ncbi:Guanylyl cyclase 1-like protein [Drosera capensis]
MWPLCVFVNKLLKLEEGDEHGLNENGSHSIPSCSLKICSISGLKSDAVLPDSRSIEVPHINQLFNWDCGLACVLMVLRATGVGNCDLLSLVKLCSSKSIWTVDLAYILQKFSISFTYFTVTLGANPNFIAESFYKDQLPVDLVRVDLLFKKAGGNGISIKCRSISQEEISFLILSGKYIAITLVDQYILSRSWLKDCTSSLDYTGHYIVICGYDTTNDEFEIRDPANSSIERVSSRCLDEARKSFGTDEDLLLISLENRLSGEKFSSANSDDCQ